MDSTGTQRMPSKADENREETVIMTESFVSPCPIQYDDSSSPPIIRRTNQRHDVKTEESMRFIPLPSFENIDTIVLPGEKSKGKLDKASFLKWRRRLTPCRNHTYFPPLPIRRTQYEASESPPKMRRSKVINYEYNRPPKDLCLPPLGDDIHASKKPSMKHVMNRRRCSQQVEHTHSSNKTLVHNKFQHLDNDRTTNAAHHNTTRPKEKGAHGKIASWMKESKSFIQSKP